ncbi:MAG: porphobilinogen synthase, partial [Actinobacteria bacterium]|nr:porphobilinogen synthase [Actinomycetota bacterium]
MESTLPAPKHRPRRLRSTPAMRRLVAETRIHPASLVLPVFVREGIDEARPISSMPGVEQHTLESVRRVAVQAAEAGIGGIMLFGVPEIRDPNGCAGDNPEGILNRAVRVVQAQICLNDQVVADLFP